MKKRRRRKCLHCGHLYHPDPRTRDRQRHCSGEQCRKASKAWRQRRWASKKENRDYHRGPDAVERVRRWRAAHPGYWRRKPPVPEDALQDDCGTQTPANQQDAPRLFFAALQDDSRAQVALLLGLAATLTGEALQDDMEPLLRRMQDRGQSLLGTVPGGNPKEYPP
jgi:hypothetical protein